MTRGLLTPQRERLPSRRRTATITPTLKFCAPGDRFAIEHAFHVTIGFYDDGRPGEVFVKAWANLDSTLSFTLEDSAVLISLLLQRGATLPEIQHSLARGHDVAATIIAALLNAIAAQESMPPLPGRAA